MIKLNRPACPNPEALKNNYKHPDNKDALKNASFDKCIYCESKVSHVYYGDVEHIKPKDSYPDLEFVWENLGYVCAKCNGTKSNKYDEDCPFIDPYKEDPSEFLVYLGPCIWQLNGNERGEYTIKEIGLDTRADLFERRLDRIKEIGILIDKIKRTSNQKLKTMAIEELRQESMPNKPYSMLVRACIQSLFQE